MTVAATHWHTLAALVRKRATLHRKVTQHFHAVVPRSEKPLSTWIKSQITQQGLVSYARDHFVLTTSLKVVLDAQHHTTVQTVWLVPLYNQDAPAYMWFMTTHRDGCTTISPHMKLAHSDNLQFLRDLCCSKADQSSYRRVFSPV